MKKSFSSVVSNVIWESDVVLEVLDARFPEKTRNQEIEDKITQMKKRIIYVLNKCDLISKKEAERIKKTLRPCVFISSTKRLGTTLLLREIMKQASYSNREKIIIGVTGYPNTGKSSVINALKGKHTAKTSSQSGFTRGKQLFKLSKNVYLMDTPGIFSYDEKDELKSILTASKDQSKIKDNVDAARNLIRSLDGTIEKFYGVEKKDPDEVLEEIAKKFNRFRKGGLPDVEVVSRRIIQDWQRGNIKPNRQKPIEPPST